MSEVLSRPRTEVVLFDFGGVVIKTPFELYDSPWRGPLDPSTDEEWRRLQAHQITEREYWHRRTAEIYPDAADPTFTFMRDLYEQDEDVIVRPELVALLDDLDEAGFRVAALTNDLTAFHPPEWVERISVIGRFDPLIDLSHVGYLKPDPRAYAHAVDALGVPPDSVVFLDDQPANVEGAVRAGLRAVRFDPAAVADSLTRLRAEVG